MFVEKSFQLWNAEMLAFSGFHGPGRLGDRICPGNGDSAVYRA